MRRTVISVGLRVDRFRCFTGKHSTKKDDYLTTMMQVPQKQRVNITQFDLRTQRDAFSVSLEGLRSVRTSQLILHIVLNMFTVSIVEY